jgi:hypothetical protein
MPFPNAAKTAAIVGTLVVLLAAVALSIAYAERRTAELRARDGIVRLLSYKFRSDVELEDFHVRLFPRMEVSGSGLSLDYWATPGAPPLIRIEKFSFELGFLGIFRAPHHIARMHFERMVVSIPPREQRKSVADRVSSGIAEVTVDEIECDNAELRMLPAAPNKQPLDWQIHNLVLRDVGGNQPFSFHGTLTNAKPRGEIATSGRFGPWNGDDPGATAVAGDYEFRGANLGEFPGIAGILSSAGHYAGELDRLEVAGQTNTPNFSLDNVGKPVPLATQYSATVDGTNGDTELHPVEAALGQSVIVAAGSVCAIPAEKGRQITLDINTPKARLEDILRLAMASERPFLRGAVDIKAKLTLPPGSKKVMDRMTLDGSFAVANGRWASPEMREKLEDFSRHAEGKPADQESGSALTDLKGRFVLKDSVVTFSELKFSVPGADVELRGTYGIRSQAIDMQGHLKMQAKLSETLTGAKSFFLKAIDPLFSKNGAGTELPISITGTEEHPVFAVEVLHKKFEKQMSKPGMR